MKLGVLLAALAGFAGAAYLVVFVGFDSIWHAVAHIGWTGFGALCLLGLANFMLLGSAWYLIVPEHGARRLLTFFWARAVRDSAGDVLPFSQLGGMLIGARAATLRGLPLTVGLATMVVDVTLEMVSQICFIVGGLLILVVTLPLEGRQLDILEAATAAIVLGLLGAGGFVVAQRRGFDALERITARFLPKTAHYAGDIHRLVAQVHAQPRRMVASFVIHFCGWIAGAVITWLALRLMGRHVVFSDAVAIESLMCALRSAAVFVPGAIGVQEAGYAVLMPLFGMPADIGLALSLLRRAQQIADGAPILLAWQLAEGGFAARLRAERRARVQG
ncbi:MAG: flippase-like domain-containing protein [Alphaproteobacteria bacterium]|nr:flippase-like domain-containing protein [Alphaproteobacteria bacterium]